jgi:hypothetical protein
VPFFNSAVCVNRIATCSHYLHLALPRTLVQHGPALPKPTMTNGGRTADASSRRTHKRRRGAPRTLRILTRIAICQRTAMEPEGLSAPRPQRREARLTGRAEPANVTPRRPDHTPAICEQASRAVAGRPPIGATRTGSDPMAERRRSGEEPRMLSPARWYRMLGRCM